MRVIAGTVLAISGTLAAVVPSSLPSFDYGDRPSVLDSSSFVPPSSTISSASSTSTSISKPDTVNYTSEAPPASSSGSSPPVAVGYNSTNSCSDQATTVSLTLTQSSITSSTSTTASTKTHTSPQAQSSSHVIHSSSTAASPVTLSSASFSEPSSTSPSSKHSEPAPGPIVVTVYDTITITASPATTPEPSTVTLTTSVFTTQNLCQTSLYTTISSGLTLTYTFTVYKASTHTLTSKLPRASSETTASSTATPLSSTSSETTSSLEVTIITTTRKTYTSTVSSSSVPTKITLSQTRRTTSTLRPTIPSSLPKYPISDNSIAASPVVPASSSSNASITPAVQTYSLLSQSYQAFVTLSTPEPTTSTVTSLHSLSISSSSSTLASGIMGNTSSMALSSTCTDISGAYNTTSPSSTPSPSRAISTVAESFLVSSFTYKPRQANSSTTKFAAPTYVSTVSGIPMGNSGQAPPAFIAESAVLAISTTTVIPDLAVQSSSSSSPDLVPAFLTVRVNSSASTYALLTAPTATSSTAKLSSTTALASSRSPAASSSISCGESGDFTLTWDDEPSFNPGPKTTTHMFPPVFNPYHHLFFASGYSYLDDQTEDAFSAVTEPTLALWLANQTDTDTGSPNAGSQGSMALMPGEIGAGPRAWSNAYWFNATEGYFGCLADGPGVCHLAVNGYIWDEYNQVEQPYASTIYDIPTCPDYKNCRMTHIRFQGQDYTGLSGIQFQMYQSYVSIYAPLRTQWRDFVMDSLSLGWYNNTCEAGLLRITQRK